MSNYHLLSTALYIRVYLRLLGLDSHLTRRDLASKDILRGREDGRPVLEGCVWYSPDITELDEVCEGVSVKMVMSIPQPLRHTFALFGEQKVGLCGGREVGDTVTSVQKHWALAIRQSRVWFDLQRLVVAEVTRTRA